MLYQHKTTGGLVEKISRHGDDGTWMVMNANDEVDYVHENDLIPNLAATNEKIKTEERLTDELKASGDKSAKPTNRETFPIDHRLNINTASARQIADSLPGVGLKTARDIKDLQTTMTGERYTKLEQLKGIKRIDWDAIFKENLVRVD
jgi:DNA uptake protein ComE-like DNA-binding protein|tara:strand:+ start:465 stop:908 length:444 start_codon:yes stop_codon:yes gene_type:complete